MLAHRLRRRPNIKTQYLVFVGCCDDALTAGRAKNDMANTEKHEATILPIQVLGTVSP